MASAEKSSGAEVLAEQQGNNQKKATEKGSGKSGRAKMSKADRERDREEMRLLSLWELESQLTPDMKKQMHQKHVQERVKAMEAEVEEQLSELTGSDVLAAARKIISRRLTDVARAAVEHDSLSGKVAMLQTQCKEATTRWQSEHNRCEKLTELSKLLQAKYANAKERSDLMQREQEKMTEMHQNFKGAVDDMAAKLDTLTQERIEGIKENERLREQLGKMVKLDTVRKEHSEHQDKATGLKMQLLEAHVKQQTSVAQLEAQRNKQLEEKLKQTLARSNLLEEQVKTYHSKFDEVKKSITEHSDIFQKLHAEKTQLQTAALASAEGQKEAQLALLKCATERKKEQAILQKALRQKKQLESLCKTLTQQQQKQKAELQALKVGVVSTDDSKQEEQNSPTVESRADTLADGVADSPAVAADTVVVDNVAMDNTTVDSGTADETADGPPEVSSTE